MLKKAFTFLSIALLFAVALTFGSGAKTVSAQTLTASNPTIQLMGGAHLKPGTDLSKLIASSVTPNSCQPASVEVVLEGLSTGHTYTCTGTHTVNDTTYFFSAGSWSGYILRSSDEILFCDGTSGNLAQSWTTTIYLSPTKESWC